MLVMLKKLKFLRGTPLDVFGLMPHRRMERGLIAWYKATIEQVVSNLTPDNLPQALEIAALPDQIRGYEQIKEQSVASVKQQASEKLEAFASTRTLAVTR